MPQKQMNIDFQINLANTERSIYGATEKLWILQHDAPRRIPPTLRSLTPDDRLSPTRRYYREYFHSQPLGSPGPITPTPPSSRSPTPERKEQKKYKPKGNRLASRRPREAEKNTIKPRRRGGSTQAPRKGGIIKARNLLPHDGHSMITRTVSRSMLTCPFFDLERPPSSEEIYTPKILRGSCQRFRGVSFCK